MTARMCTKEYHGVYSAAYERCVEINQKLEALKAEHPRFKGVEEDYRRLSKEGEVAYFDLLHAYHQLNTFSSLDVMDMGTRLHSYGVRTPYEVENGN